MRTYLLLMTVVLIGGLVAACSSVVGMPDAYDGEPIDVAMDQTFEIELGTDRMINNDPDVHEWILVDSGVLRLVSEVHATRPEDENEFVGGVSRHTLFTFEPVSVGTGDVVFGYVPVDGTELVNTFVVAISVAE